MINRFLLQQSAYSFKKIFFAFCFILAISTTHFYGQQSGRKVSQTFYFTGNTGVDESDYTKQVLSVINEMSQKDEKATFVAIGNITSKQGFPPKPL